MFNKLDSLNQFLIDLNYLHQVFQFSIEKDNCVSRLNDRTNYKFMGLAVPDIYPFSYLKNVEERMREGKKNMNYENHEREKREISVI